MSRKLAFELLTPAGILLSDSVLSVIVPGEEGYLGAMPGHEYFATTLKSGMLIVRDTEKSRRYRVTDGIVQITPDKVVVCAEEAELVDIEHH